MSATVQARPPASDNEIFNARPDNHSGVAKSMRDAEMWRAKAAMLRASAVHRSDAESQQVLLVLADDCEELAANLDATECGEK